MEKFREKSQEEVLGKSQKYNGILRGFFEKKSGEVPRREEPLHCI